MGTVLGPTAHGHGKLTSDFGTVLRKGCVCVSCYFSLDCECWAHSRCSVWDVFKGYSICISGYLLLSSDHPLGKSPLGFQCLAPWRSCVSPPGRAGIGQVGPGAAPAPRGIQPWHTGSPWSQDWRFRSALGNSEAAGLGRQDSTP